MVSDKFSTASPILANFSYTDIAEGTGVVVFYPATHQELTTVGTYLTPQTLRSKHTSYGAAATGVAEDVNIIDKDFDLATFNLPKRVKGTVNVTGYVGHYTGQTTSAHANVYLVAKLRKWDGSTETEIATATSETYEFVTSGSSTTTTSHPFNMAMTAPLTNFQRGDTLRLTLQLYAGAGGTGSAANKRVGFGCDPANREDILPLSSKIIEDAHDTSVVAYVPFLLDGV